MKRLYFSLAVCIVMAALIPGAPAMAVTKDSALFTHFFYMFAHANILHWLINSWSLLVLHNVLRWHRLLVAYLIAVTLSFIPWAAVANSSLFTLHSSLSPRPVLGLSVITTFFFGFLTPYYWNRNRSIPLMMAAIILIGCFIPGVAAAFHVIPFAVGIAYWHVEGHVRSFLHFIR